jgi:uncharacterized RDD family membrane protein YckC
VAFIATSSDLYISPGWFRRLASLVYDLLLLLAILMFAALVFLFIFGDATATPKRYFFQFYLWLISAAYFVWNWSTSGQTLAMQTWRIRVIAQSGEPLAPTQAMKRFIFASVFFGLSFIWAFFDRERLYLHDRLSGTRLVVIEKGVRQP